MKRDALIGDFQELVDDEGKQRLANR